MTALHLPKCRALAPSRVREGAERSSPQVRCQPVGQGLPSRDGCSKLPVFEPAPAMPSGRAVGRRGGS